MSQERRNNFDALRLLAAGLVLYLHAHPLYGIELPRPLVYGPQERSDIHLGTVGVSIFFTLSGYLVTASWARTKSLAHFLENRALRIYPGLLAEAAFLFLLLLPLVNSIPHYFSSFLPGQAALIFSHAVFKFDMPEGLLPVFMNVSVRGSVNPPLWTLAWEVGCYLGVAALGCTVGLGRRVLPALLVLFAALSWQCISVPYKMNPDYGLLHCCSFIMGAGLFAYRDVFRISRPQALLCGLGLAAMFAFNLYIVPLYVVLLAGAVIYLATEAPYFGNVAKHGDFSYGIYIYHWPVMQSVLTLGGGRLPFPAFLALSVLCTLALAALSWHLVEKQVLKFRN